MENVATELAPLAEKSPPASKAPRLDSVDLLRGIIMVVMALDHVRDFFTNLRYDPLDLSQTSAVLFLTRWVTHYCAPIFIFLAGTGAFLGASRGKSKGELARFLWTRGLWLILLDMTVIKVSWAFNLDFKFNFMMILWPIGFAMIVLAALVHVPAKVIGLIGVLIVATHNLLDHLSPEAFGPLSGVWKMLHAGGTVELGGGVTFFATYALWPWLGVMMAGYGFGTLLIQDRQRRRPQLFWLGISLCLLFVLVRGINRYGDPRPWAPQATPLFTLLSFLNCAKYPPSLDYALMTIGPGILFLSLADRPLGKLAQKFIVFGRVPLFYYLLHAPLIHTLALLIAWANGQGPLGSFLAESQAAGYGYGLGVVYALWVLVVVALYFPCRWFADLKRRRRDAWLSYL
jgi:uncharacterized membrane protein